MTPEELRARVARLIEEALDGEAVDAQLDALVEDYRRGLVPF